MKILAIATAAAVAVTGCAGSAYAQDVEAKQRENTTTYVVYMVKIHWGKGGEFEERVKLQNEVAAELGEAPAQIHHVMTGGYDRMIIVEMKEGMAALDWEITPSDARFRNAMIARMGADDYQAWIEKWPEITERPKIFYTHLHND